MQEFVFSYIQAVSQTEFMPFRASNVVEGNAVAISVTGMLIVFSALTLITVFIAMLPRILSSLDPYLPAVSDHHHQPTPADALPMDEERIVAAIGAVLHAEMQKAIKR